MTGKQLKEFAAQVHDDAVIEVCDYNYGAFKKEFSVRATLQCTLEWKEDRKHPAEAEQLVK